MSSRTCAMFVIYNPSKEVLGNVLDVLLQVEKVYIIDNSPSDEFVTQILEYIADGKVEYYNFKNNIGIAKALNEATSRAFSAGFDVILTMDQDSAFPVEGVGEMYRLSGMPSRDVLLISPTHLGRYGVYDSGLKNKTVKNENCAYEIQTVMTSGNLVDIRNLLRIGGYEEDYFIDYVDHEVCLRAKLHGLRILTTNKVIMRHNLGNVDKEFRVIGIKFTPTNHNYIRRYYMTRNRLKIYKKYIAMYPAWCIKDIGKFIKELISIVLFERKKRKKLYYTFKGIIHFLTSTSGKIKDA